jgi:hypothetical protein
MLHRQFRYSYPAPDTPPSTNHITRLELVRSELGSPNSEPCDGKFHRRYPALSTQTLTHAKDTVSAGIVAGRWSPSLASCPRRSTT